MKRAIVVLVGMIAPALGQAQGEFARGKVVELYIGYSVGGGYDVYARLLARHMGRHLPGNPVVVPRNMEGAGSLRLAEWLYKERPRGGRGLGTTRGGLAFDPPLGPRGNPITAPSVSWDGKSY